MECSCTSFFLFISFCMIFSTNTYAALDASSAAATTSATQEPPIHNQLYTSYTPAEKAILASLASSASIRGEQFYLSHPKITAELKKALTKKTTLSLSLNASTRGHKQLISELGSEHVALSHNTHAKVWSIRQNGTPATPPKKKKAPSLRRHDHLFIGSANATRAAHRNFEVTYETNDPELCSQFAELHDNPPDTPSKKERSQLPTILSTPPKPRLFHSYTTKLNPSRAHRIETAIAQKKANPKLSISIAMSTMNINDQKTLKLLAQAASHGITVTLYLDRDALSETKKKAAPGKDIDKIEHLNACRDAGVNIFVFDPYNTGSAIMHSKLFLRTIDTEQFLEISTANATQSGDEERNYSLMIPKPEKHVVADCQEHMSDIRPLPKLIL